VTEKKNPCLRRESNDGRPARSLLLCESERQYLWLDVHIHVSVTCLIWSRRHLSRNQQSPHSLWGPPICRYCVRDTSPHPQLTKCSQVRTLEPSQVSSTSVSLFCFYFHVFHQLRTRNEWETRDSDIATAHMTEPGWTCGVTKQRHCRGPHSGLCQRQKNQTETLEFPRLTYNTYVLERT